MNISESIYPTTVMVQKQQQAVSCQNWNWSHPNMPTIGQKQVARLGLGPISSSFVLGILNSWLDSCGADEEDWWCSKGVGIWKKTMLHDAAWINNPSHPNIHRSVSHVLLQGDQFSIFLQMSIRYDHPGVVFQGLGLTQHASKLHSFGGRMARWVLSVDFGFGRR